MGAVTHVGAVTLMLCQECLGICRVFGCMVNRLRRGHIDREELLRAVNAFGVEAVPVVVMTAGFAGLIMVLQASVYVRYYGITDRVGWFAGFTVLREVGPILIGLMFSGRVGASYTAELATLGATEKLVALEAMAVDVYGWIIVPRAVAMVMCLVLLLVLGDAVAVGVASVGAHYLLDLPYAAFGRSLIAAVAVIDLFIGLGKIAFFGVVLACISTHAALRRTGGASLVGRAVHHQVVACASALFLCDALWALVLPR